MVTTIEQLTKESEARIIAALKDEPGLRSVVLMGSLAKRNPAIDPRSGTILSDADVIAVVDRTAFPRWVLRQGRLQSRLESALNTPASVAPITPGMLRSAVPSVWFYEVKFGGRTINGKDHLAEIPIKRPEDIDPRQGLIVGSNYLQEVAKFFLRPPSGQADQAKIARSVLSASDSWGASFGFYTSDLAERLRRTEQSVEFSRATNEYRRIWLELVPIATDVRAGSATRELSRERAAEFLRMTLLEIAAIQETPRGAPSRVALETALGRSSRAIDRIQSVLLRSIQTKRPWPLLRPTALDPARIRLDLFDTLSEVPVDRRKLSWLLANWRAASPAYTLI